MYREEGSRRAIIGTSLKENRFFLVTELRIIGIGNRGRKQTLEARRDFRQTEQ